MMILLVVFVLVLSGNNINDDDGVVMLQYDYDDENKFSPDTYTSKGPITWTFSARAGILAWIGGLKFQPGYVNN